MGEAALIGILIGTSLTSASVQGSLALREAQQAKKREQRTETRLRNETKEATDARNRRQNALRAQVGRSDTLLAGARETVGQPGGPQVRRPTLLGGTAA